MKTILRFEFDQQLFPVGYQGDRNIIFTDPSHIPVTGDPVDFQISDFFNDPQFIEAYEDMTEGRLLYAERLNTRYAKDQVEIVVVLYREMYSKRNFRTSLTKLPPDYHITKRGSIAPSFLNNLHSVSVADWHRSGPAVQAKAERSPSNRS